MDNLELKNNLRQYMDPKNILPLKKHKAVPLKKDTLNVKDLLEAAVKGQRTTLRTPMEIKLK